MADAKVGEKKDVKPTNNGVSWEEIILLILGIVALLFVFLPKITDINKKDSGFVNSKTERSLDIKGLYDKVFNEQHDKILNNNGQVIAVKKPSLVTEARNRMSDILSTVSVVIFSGFIFLTLLLSMIIYYNKFRRELIIAEYKKKFETEEEIKAEVKIEEANEKIIDSLTPDDNGMVNPRWEIVQKYYNSANQSDWKLAILEADIMLYEVLNKSGFDGYSIGEMLKSTDKSKLNSLDEAWSAHKIRNEIAHSGTSYILSRDLVEKAISQYEKVFNELNFI